MSSIDEAKDWWDKATPKQREDMLRKQRESYVRAEIAFGSDKDEAFWRKAYEENDTETLRRLKHEETQRLARYDEKR